MGKRITGISKDGIISETTDPQLALRKNAELA
jgi:hypothetical protein